MDFAALITDLKAKLATANQRLGKLAEQRRPHALDAVTGGIKAKRAIEKINTQAAATRSEAETLAAAIEEAEKRKTEHEARLAAEDRRRREAEAREVSEAILGEDREFDRLAGLACQSLERREALVRKLDGLGVVYGGVIAALHRKLKINGALLSVGLGRHCNLERVAPAFRLPLAEADKSISKPLFTSDNESAEAKEVSYE